VLETNRHEQSLCCKTLSEKTNPKGWRRNHATTVGPKESGSGMNLAAALVPEGQLRESWCGCWRRQRVVGMQRCAMIRYALGYHFGEEIGRVLWRRWEGTGSRRIFWRECLSELKHSFFLYILIIFKFFISSTD